jgi:signal transduction histidine kinase
MALALLYDPFTAAGVAAVAAGIADASLRRRWYVLVFGVAERALTIALGSAVAHAFELVPDPASGVGAVAAGATIFLSNSVCISAVSAARRGAPFLRAWATVCRSEGMAEAGLLSAGALLAVLYGVEPAAIPLVVPPLWLAWHALASSAEIRSLNERLESSVATQRRFVADAAHELRTPTASARAQLTVLRRELPAASALAALVDGIDGEMDRMSRLLDDLLTLARADEGLAVAKAPVDLEDVLLAVYRGTRPFAGRVRFRLDVGDDAHPPVVVGDAERLRQLFVNQVSNALRFTPDGGLVEVRCRREARAAVVSIRDSGIGIGPDEIARVFDRFYSGNASRARDGDAPGGAGLGLSIARWIAEAHGGPISVESVLGKGSTFTVRLPLAPAAVEALPVPAPSVGPPKTDAAR